MHDDLSRRDVAKALSATIAVGKSTAAAHDEVDPVQIFTGGVMLLYTRGRNMGMPAIMTNCRFERREGRLFVVGVNQPCRSNLFEWTNGTTRCVAWDAVDEYLVFDSLATFHASQKRQDEENERKAESDRTKAIEQAKLWQSQMKPGDQGS